MSSFIQPNPPLQQVRAIIGIFLIALTAQGVTPRVYEAQQLPTPGPAPELQTSQVVDYFGLPPVDSVLVVGNSDAGSPTQYPPQRKTAYSPGGETFFALYHDGSEPISKYWANNGGIEFWSFATTFVDAGVMWGTAPSVLGTEDGAAVSYHGTRIGAEGEWDVFFNVFDLAQDAWRGSVQVTPADEIPSTNAFLGAGGEGLLFVVGTEGEGSEVDVAHYRSLDDGASWARSLVAAGVNYTWLMPSGAADPVSGDLYVAYQDLLDGRDAADIVLHRSTDGGETWSSGQVAAPGAPGAQAVEPSIVVDASGTVHLLYQANLSETYGGGLSGLAVCGPVGVPWYVRGHFEGADWVPEGQPRPLSSREDLVAVPDSCGLTPDLATLATDTLSAMPQLGIDAGPGGGMLYATVSQPYLAVAGAGGGWEVCGPFQVWLQTLDLGAGANEFSARRQVSVISAVQGEQGRNANYAGISHAVPRVGPGLVWGEMWDALPPSQVMFSRPQSQGLEAEQNHVPAFGALLHPAAPSPFNPRTWISFELASDAALRLAVFDVGGRLIRVLAQGQTPAGSYRVVWDGRNDLNTPMPSGLYYYRLETGKSSLTRSMLLLK